MDAFDEPRRAWTEVEARFMWSPWMRQLDEGDVGPGHYASFLRETYFLPTSRSGEICAGLARLGVPSCTMAPLTGLQTVDIDHVRAMELHNPLLLTQTAVYEVIYSMEVTGHLYASMIGGAFKAHESLAKRASPRQLEAIA